MRASVVASLLLLFSGCGPASSNEPAPLNDEGLPELDVSGQEGIPIPATNIADILVVDVSVNGVSAPIGVDTGSPVLLLGPSGFPKANLPNGAGTVDTMTLGALTFKNAYVVAADLITSPDEEAPLHGLLGCQILCNFAVTFNYRDQQLTLGQGSLPNHIGEDVATPFSLLGGGQGAITGVSGIVHIPKSRVVVKATVEGVEHSFMVDTGASITLLRSALLDDLAKDGRAVMGGLQSQIVGGTTSISVARLKSVSIGGEEVKGLIASEDETFEKALDAVSLEIGQKLDGLIGGSYLRNFYVTIDYPNTTFHLRRYAEGAPTYDAFDRVAFSVNTKTKLIEQVIAGTKAEEMGLTKGDEVLEVDGVAIDSAEVSMAGEIGSSKMIHFGKTAKPELSMQTVAIPVEDILPLAK